MRPNMKTQIRFDHTRYSDEALNNSISGILADNTLMAVASIKDKESYIHTAYYVYNKDSSLFMLTEPFRQHSLNVVQNSSVAVAIYDSHQPWDQHKRGLQIFGKCSLASGAQMAEGFLLYAQRFSGLTKWIKNVEDLAKNIIQSKLYVIETRSLKLFDEHSFGAEVWIPLTVRP